MTCLQQNKQPAVSGIDGRAPVVIGLAAQRSVEERRVVQISEFANS